MGATIQGWVCVWATVVRYSAIRGSSGRVVVVLMQKRTKIRLEGVWTKCVWVWGKGEECSEVPECSGDVCVRLLFDEGYMFVGAMNMKVDTVSV